MEIGDIVVSKEQKTIVRVVSVSRTGGTFCGIVIDGGNSGLIKGDYKNNFISSCFTKINITI